MLTYPHLNPIALTLGPVQIHWYGVMYILGFICAWIIAKHQTQKLKLHWSTEQISDLIFYAAVGIIIGGRLGYMFFYNFYDWLSHPFLVFKIWQGGMSFHGGLIGALIGLVYVAKHQHRQILEVTDFTAPLVPLGLATGRFGNFINGELWGRPTSMPWGMIFPGAGPEPRHPSQLYELGLEGLLLFIVLFLYTQKRRPTGYPTAFFLMGYSLLRFTVEFFREPDAHLGFVIGDWLSMGQILCIPMFISGFIIWYFNRHHENVSSTS